MKGILLQEEAQLALYFIFFSLLSLLVLSLTPFPPGVKLFSLVAFFHLSFPLISKALRWHSPLQIWKFLLPLSAFMVFPDWFLSSVLQVLVFPEDGFPKIGTVSGYMAGLWVLPLFILVYTGIKLEERSVSILGICGWISFLGLLVFGFAEETMWMIPSWYAQNVTIIGHTAIYVLPAEMILAVTTYLTYQGFSNEGWMIRIGTGFLIMLQYLGSLGFFYLLVEKIL